MDTKIIPRNTPLIEWSAPQHAHPERGKTWYVCASIFIILCVIYSIVTRAWTFTAVIAILVFFYFRVHNEKPGKKHIRIWSRGFAIGNDFTDFSDCAGFWILVGNSYAELHIELKNGRETKIQTGNENIHQIHEIFVSLLPELTGRRERILDTIIRICKL